MSNILAKLESLDIPFELFEHEPFFTCDDSRKFYEGREGGDSKNLFLRDRKGKQHYLVVLQADKRLDLKAFSQSMDERLSFGSPERLMKWLGVTPGAVSPLNLIHDEENHVIVYIDEDLLKYEDLYYHPGRNDQTVKLSSKDIQNYLEAIGNEWSKASLPTMKSE
jgi:Ala-tRNA(Pro) deacylase